MSKEIPLTQGYCAIVDDDDYNELSKYKWHINDRKRLYAVRTVGTKTINSKREVSKVYMHRQIMKPQGDLVVDHINGNNLDNRKSNMRTCRQRDNTRNCKLSKNNTSGYYGVSPIKNKWSANIHYLSKKIFLGNYNNIKDAAKAYNKAAKEYFNGYARLNEV